VIAQACLAGLPGWLVATTDDPVTLDLLQAASRAALRQQEVRDKNLAVYIANAIARSQRG